MAASDSREDYCSHLGLRVEDVPVARGRLSADEWLVLVTYVCTIGLILKGPAHLLGGRWRARGQAPPWWTEKTVYAPLLGLVFLAIASAIGGHELVTGRAVRETLAAKIPIILLILSFAYLSISLDVSGFFKAASALVVGLAGGNGHRLLIYIYVLCSVLTYFTSNDIVILSMTPLIMHVGDCSSIRDAVPLLVSQYIAANTAAMGLLVGSPTNIILGDAVQLSFARYWVLMLLPTVVAIAATLVMILVVFVWAPTRGHAMQRQFTMLAPGEAPSHVGPVAPKDENEEGGAMLELTTPPSATMAVLADAPPEEDEDGDEEEPPPPPGTPSKASLMTAPKTRRAKVAVFAMVLLLLAIANFIQAELWAISFVSALVMLAVDLSIVHFDGHSKLSFLVRIYGRLPWSIAPFVLCMFILVRVLTDTGFTGRFAHGMVAIAGGSVWSQSLVFSLVAALLVNVLNDLPSTVCWSSMLPILCDSYPARNFHVVLQALLVGVNPGVYLSVLGALAGIVWISIIHSQPSAKRLVCPTALDLTYYGTLVLIPVMVVTCMAISVQSYMYGV